MNKITLIIDDDKMVRSLNRKLIISLDLSKEPSLFCNGKEALEFLIKNYSENDQYLIFLDIEMPLMSGWEFLNEINLRFPANNFYVVVSSTSLDSPDVKRKVFYKQVKYYCNKPIPNHLLSHIKEEFSNDTWIR